MPIPGRGKPVIAAILLGALAAHPTRADTEKANARSPGAASGAEAQLAFPGAEGFGRFARGGRGGDVAIVTNLNDSGPGSLREAIAGARGPRTIVFEISGTIELKHPLVVDKPCLTIAGQTAPGDGITLKDHTFQIENASDVIVRYLRVRLGDKNKPVGADDTLFVGHVHNLMLDHLSASWGIDGIMDLEYASNVTLQWSIFAEALNGSIHHKGEHAMLSSWRKLKGNVTLHHNLLASSRNRHPTLGSSRETIAEAVVDFRNNVVYNWEGPSNLGNCRIDVIANDYCPGPNTRREALPLAVKADRLDVHLARGYLRDNLFESNDEWTRDNYRAVNYTQEADSNYGSTTRAVFEAHAPFVAASVAPRTHSPRAAHALVLDGAGASRSRDAADRRLIAGVRARTHRRIDSQDEVGGWPLLESRPAPADADRDGMADAWERSHGLNPALAADRNGDRDGDGYTNLEEYLSSLCPAAAGDEAQAVTAP
jgi:hypothetical protein